MVANGAQVATAIHLRTKLNREVCISVMKDPNRAKMP